MRENAGYIAGIKIRIIIMQMQTILLQIKCKHYTAANKMQRIMQKINCRWYCLKYVCKRILMVTENSNNISCKVKT